MKAAANRTATLTILAALCLGIQLLPRPPNVEFTSLIVFFVGASFGILIGSTLGAAVMVINGFYSSWGFAGLLMPFQIAGMALIGVVGGLYGGTKKGAYARNVTAEAAVLGAFLTLVYDLVTSFGFVVSYMTLPILPAFVATIVSGAVFSAVHVVSNFFVFGLTFYPLMKVTKELLGGEKAWTNNFSST